MHLLDIFLITEITAFKGSNSNITNIRADDFDTPPRPLQFRYVLTDTCVRWWG